MNLEEVLRLFLILGIISVASCFIVSSFFLIRALKAFTNLIEDLQSRTLSALPSLLIGLIGKFIRKRR